MLSSEIDLLMYSTFAVQSGESARQQRLALVLPYVLLWSNRAVIHLDRDDSWTNPLWRAGYGRTRETLFGGFRIKLRGHPASCVPVLAKLENPKVASFGMATFLCTALRDRA